MFFIYATFGLTSEVKVVKSKNDGIPYIDINTKFQILDPNIQMKRPKRPLHTHIPTYLLTNFPSHGVSYKPVMRIRIQSDPDSFGSEDPDPGV